MTDDYHKSKETLIAELQALRQQKQPDISYTIMFEQASIGMMVCNKAGKIIQHNPILATMFGYEPQGLVGLSINDLVPETFKSSHQTNLATFFKAPYHRPMGTGLNLYGQRKDGSTFPVEVSLSYDDSGPEMMALAFVSDLMSQRAYQDSIAKYQQKTAEFEAMFTSLADGAIFTNINREITRINPALTKMMGYTLEDLATKTTEVLYANPEDYAVQGWKRFNNNNKAENISTKPYQVAYRRKDGSVFMSETVGQAVKNETGETLGFLGLIRDITERKENEARMALLYKIVAKTSKDINEQLQTALDLCLEMFGLDVAIISRIEGDNYSIEYCHPISETLKPGVSFPLAQTYCDITLRTDHVVAIENMSQSEYLHHPCYQTFQLESYIGSAISVHGERYGTLNFSGAKPRSTLFTEADKTYVDLLAYWVGSALERKIAEDLLKTVYHELAQKAQALTDANEELAQYTKELENRNEELDAFSHTVAHDLQGPVSVIIGMVDMLKYQYQDNIDSLLAEYLKTITESSKRISNIIRELLLLASVRKKDIMPEAIYMNYAIEEALARLETMIQEYEATIHLDDQSYWPVALGYSAWVQEIWVNYISNAIKYGGSPPVIWLEAETLPEVEKVKFSVRDNGAGLTPEEQAVLFTPFTRLSQVNTKGHGLGLSIVQRITEKLNGEVGVESEIGKGCTFYFILPIINLRREG